MSNKLSLINQIKKNHSISTDERFEISDCSTNHLVFLSANYVIRFRDNDPYHLLRETEFLKELDHKLIPKIIWSGKLENTFYMIENRLPGIPVNLIWNDLKVDDKNTVVSQIRDFLKFKLLDNRDYFYSVKTGKKYLNFADLLVDGLDSQISEIKKISNNTILKDIISIINNTNTEQLFNKKDKISLVHGDLIIHNILVKDNALTGIIDWELAIFGDSDYDIHRLLYYQECAKDYAQKDLDQTFELQFVSSLLSSIWNSDMIQNKNLFLDKYKFVRAIFYTNALFWAIKSDNPIKNIEELNLLWKKRVEDFHINSL